MSNLLDDLQTLRRLLEHETSTEDDPLSHWPFIDATDPAAAEAEASPAPQIDDEALLPDSEPSLASPPQAEHLDEIPLLEEVAELEAEAHPEEAGQLPSQQELLLLIDTLVARHLERNRATLHQGILNELYTLYPQLRQD